MSIWFKGSGDIECSIEQVTQASENLGELFVGVVSLMPGLTSVELVEEGKDFVTIKTNEGLMKRTGISRRMEGQTVTIEFNEEYKAGSMVTARSHLLDEFTASGTHVEHRTEISDVKAPGFLGFFYRLFGSSSIGKAILKSYKAYLEK
jgi:hypothetical protein